MWVLASDMQIATSPRQQLRAKQLTLTIHAWEARRPPQMCSPQLSNWLLRVRGRSAAAASRPVPHAVMGYGAAARSVPRAAAGCGAFATCSTSSSSDPMQPLGNRGGGAGRGRPLGGVPCAVHHGGMYKAGLKCGTLTGVRRALPPGIQGGGGGRGGGGEGGVSSALDPASFVSAITAAAARLEKQQQQQRKEKGQTLRGDLLSDVDTGFLDMAFAGSALGIKVWGSVGSLQKGTAHHRHTGPL